MTMNASAPAASSSARSHATRGSCSPNQTTSGLIQWLQRGQGRSGRGSAMLTASRYPHPPLHLSRSREPCRCTMLLAPARSRRSSTFWVIFTISHRSANAWWAALGRAEASLRRRSLYQPTTSPGSAAKPSGLARGIGSYLAHSPVCASRKVGTPDSALRPAPENVTGRVEFRRALLAASSTWPPEGCQHSVYEMSRRTPTTGRVGGGWGLVVDEAV